MRSMKYLTLLIVMGVSLTLVRSACAETISQVLVRGNQRVEERSVLAVISSKAGGVFDEQGVTEDIRKIYNTGFFEKVAGKKYYSERKLVLVFIVKERPAVRKLLIKGNDEIKDEKLKEKLNVGSRRFLDKKKIKAGIDSALEYYHSEGFIGTKIDYEVSQVEDNQVDVTFNIDEGEKLVIREIVFDGAKSLDEGDLQGAIQSRTYSWWRSWLTGRGDYIEEALKQDSKALAHHYLTKGFVDVKVAEPVTERTADGVRVIYKIEEGKVFQFGDLSAEGDLVNGSSVETVAGTKIEKGGIFNVDFLRESVFTVSEKFTDVGYAFVNVEPLTEIDRDKGVVNVRYKVDKGVKVRIDRINISGNQKTQDRVVRRSLKILEDEVFSSSKVQRSKTLLERLGFFEEVAITPQKTTDPERVDMLVNVKEGSTGTFSIGAGLSSGDGFSFMSQISENNLLGSGNSVSLDILTGTKRERYMVSFLNPRVDDTYFSLGTRLSSSTAQYETFDRAQKGGSVSVGYPLYIFGEEIGEDISAGLSYELFDINIKNVEDEAAQLVKDQAGKTTSSSITPSLVRNTINNPMDPTEGSRQSMSFQYAGLGGDQKFWLLDLENSWYFPLFDTRLGKIVFAQRSSLAYGESLNNDETFPLFRRFFPGGINSVRGYDARSMGPKDENGEVYGGSKEVVFNFELLAPILPEAGIKGLLFFDIGQAYADEQSIDFGLMRAAYGFGIRWRTPMAPIRLEFGLPLDKEEGDKSFVTNFTFGIPN